MQRRGAFIFFVLLPCLLCSPPSVLAMRLRSAEGEGLVDLLNLSLGIPSDKIGLMIDVGAGAALFAKGKPSDRIITTPVIDTDAVHPPPHAAAPAQQGQPAAAKGSPMARALVRKIAKEQTPTAAPAKAEAKHKDTAATHPAALLQSTQQAHAAAGPTAVAHPAVQQAVAKPSAPAVALPVADKHTSAATANANSMAQGQGPAKGTKVVAVGAHAQEQKKATASSQSAPQAAVSVVANTKAQPAQATQPIVQSPTAHPPHAQSGSAVQTGGQRSAGSGGGK